MPTPPPRKYSTLSDLQALLPIAEQGKRQDLDHDGKGKAIRVLLDTRGRKGKVVTLIIGLQHNPQTVDALAGTLKRHCGAGGTVREGTIELQGDQRERAGELLRELNYRVSIVGKSRG